MPIHPCVIECHIWTELHPESFISQKSKTTFEKFRLIYLNIIKMIIETPADIKIMGSNKHMKSLSRQ